MTPMRALLIYWIVVLAVVSTLLTVFVSHVTGRLTWGVIAGLMPYAIVAAIRVAQLLDADVRGDV